MRKFTKICLVISMILGILGSALCISAVSLGVPLEAVKTMISDGELGEALANLQDVDESLRDVEEEFSEIDRLKIEVGVDEVAIHTYDGDTVWVKAENVTSKFECRQSGGELKIEDKAQKINFGIFSENTTPKIVIYLPENLKLKGLELDVDVGSVETEEIEVEKLKIECGVGSVYFMGKVNEEGKVECGIGEVRINLDGAKEQYNYNLECGIGSIQIGEDYESSIPGNKYIDYDAKDDFEIDCGIGSVTVEFSE